MQLRKEIQDRQKDLEQLQNERHQRQVQLETEKDRLAGSEKELDARKKELMHKRIELEKTDALKELTVRQVHDVSPSQLFALLFLCKPFTSM